MGYNVPESLLRCLWLMIPVTSHNARNRWIGSAESKHWQEGLSGYLARSWPWLMQQKQQIGASSCCERRYLEQ